MKIRTWLALVFIALQQPALANGGGYFRGGVEQAGDVAGFEPLETEKIRILDEKLTVALGPKSADVEVRYLMRNETDKKVKVRFGFPVEESFECSGTPHVFGNHVAALLQDREPVGSLDGNDLVKLAKLAETRPVFSLRVPRVSESCQVKFAGDVVLAGEDRQTIANFTRGDADLFLVNLEGIPSLRPPAEKLRYDFRFPPERLGWLKERGVDAASLANNHAGDAGPDGLIEGMADLEKAGIAWFGAGKNEAQVCQPWRVERKVSTARIRGE